MFVYKHDMHNLVNEVQKTYKQICIFMYLYIIIYLLRCQ